MTPGETDEARALRHRLNALEGLSAAAATAKAHGATDGDLVRAVVGSWYEGDEVTQADTTWVDRVEKVHRMMTARGASLKVPDGERSFLYRRVRLLLDDLDRLRVLAGEDPPPKSPLAVWESVGRYCGECGGDKDDHVSGCPDA